MVTETVTTETVVDAGYGPIFHVTAVRGETNVDISFVHRTNEDVLADVRISKADARALGNALLAFADEGTVDPDVDHHHSFPDAD